MSRVISVKTLKETKFRVMEFSEEWARKYGHAEEGFKAIFYGGSGSGKSTEALKFCQYLAENFGRVLYNSHEEGISATLQERVIHNNIDSQRISFGDRMSYDAMCEKAARGRYKFIVIDSLNYMNFTYAEYKDFYQRFKKRKGLIIIAQVNGRGKIKGGTDFLHAVDIKAEFNNGKLNVKSRFLQGGHSETQLFSVNGKSVNRTLFNQI